MNELYAIREVKGRVFKVESLNTHNGPGYRTVIYLKGCPLRCLWCHNPEGISPQKEIWVIKSKCIGCLSCVEVCPNSALSMTPTGIEVDRDKCEGCYQCADVCPSTAIEKIGIDYTVDELFRRIEKDKPFLNTSGGGVTLTGGEPGMAREFVSRLFKRCRENDIHTAFDTSGFVSQKALEEIIPHTDLVFFDLKIMDNHQALELTGKGTRRIFKSLHWILEYNKKHGVPELQFRTPIIPGSTANMDNLSAIAQFLTQHCKGQFTQWELNLFNDVCEDKYDRLGKQWHYTSMKLTKDNFLAIEAFKAEYPEFNIEISGFIEK